MPCIVKGSKARHIRSEGFCGFCYKFKHNYLHFARLFDKIFTFEKRNLFLFFSLNQIFRNFAIKIANLLAFDIKNKYIYFVLSSFIRNFAT